VVLPVEINDSSGDLGDSGDALERNVGAEDGDQNKAQQVRAHAAAKAAQLRGQAAEKAPQVRAQAVEKAQQIRVRAAEKAPQVAQANRGKAVGALAFVLLVLWLRRRRNRRSRTGDGVAVVLDQQARSVVGDTVDALSAEVASTDGAQDKARKVRGRAAARTQARAQVVEKAQQVRAQAAEKAQQLREQAVERAQQLREQAAEKTQAAEKAQQLAQEAQQLVQALAPIFADRSAP
jgi:uncharacterized coiled-coil DUF342 family protein